MTTGTFSIKEVLTFGWTAFKKDPWFYAGATLALVIISVLVNELTGRSGILNFVVSMVVSTFISVAYSKMALAAEAGGKATWAELWAPEHFLNLLGASLIVMVVVGVGFVLLIIPGVVAALILCMTQLSVVDRKMNPIDAVKNSYYLTKGHLFELFLMMVVLIVLNIVGFLALGVGLLVTIPITVIAVARVYRILTNRQEPVVVVQPNEGPQN